MAELNPDGLVIRTRDQIVEDINKEMLDNFGNQFDVTPESPDGQIIGILADAISNAEQAVQAVWQSSDPDSAFGVALDYVCEYNGVFRRLNTATVVTVAVGGVTGTVIPQGSVVSDGISDFTTDREVTIPANVSVTCQTLGRVEVPANTVTNIKTNIVGWNTVNNPNAGETGTDRESDSALRTRRARSTINTGANTTESIYEALTKLGVDFVAIEENDTGTPSPTPVPAKAFLTVVSGGTDSEIAARIFANKPAGIQAYGTTTVTVNDSKGYPHTVGFSRPTNQTVEIDVTFQRLSGASNESIDNMRNSLIAYVNGLNISEDVIWSQLFGECAKEDGISIRTFRIRVTGGSYGNNDLPMSIVQKAVTDAASITITEV